MGTILILVVSKLKTTYVRVDAKSALEVLDRVVVGNVTDDSEVSSDSVYRVHVKICDFLNIYIPFYFD
jgi:hypothetical protein